MKHIVITDSGVGGLSVVAYAERFLRTHGFEEPVRLTFANAAPENDYGYNSMPTRDVKLETFDRFLRNVTDRFAPDMIYVACNTLSVLLPDTPYFRTAAIPVKGIIDTAIELLMKELDPESIALIFATQTTTDAGEYPRRLIARGITPTHIISQACPGLADTISEDREGTKAKKEITSWVTTALQKSPQSHESYVAALACTHYGYRKQDFAEALNNAPVINPNESAVNDLFPRFGGRHRDVDVQFVTRYVIPPATIETLTFFLGGISPRTVFAMQNFIHVPDLF